MAWDLEGLISHLLMLISCAGEQGCPVDEIINEIKGSSDFSGPRNRNTGEPLADDAVVTVWHWLVARNDVSVGLDRQYNDLPIHELTAFTGKLAQQRDVSEEAQCHTSRPASLKLKSGDSGSFEAISAARVYTSEDTMWEVITGHSANYKRVPRSEWLLLLGIASTKSQGILQGDLGRLVDQDKRSVPKRTDSLVKKGYIVKRTTLVRGTKTSKLWLKSFAPPLPKESVDHTVDQEAEMNLSQYILAANLDQVPWHTRWTGDSMDFHALATTIIAVAKEWQVIRLQDLKAKLGVLGMRWQMKIVSKICRFLNSCGAIQYVAATLDNKIFKDCIRFNRDLSTKDWSAFLATGKRAAKPIKTALLSIAERVDPDWQADNSQINGARLGEYSPWCVDDPLPQKITKSAQSFGTVGLTNPEIYVLTLGPSFNRYISSMTSCMAGSNVQPRQLQHLQLKSEHIRVGKVASYRYYTPPLLSAAAPNAVLESGNGPRASATYQYGFCTPSCKPKFSGLDNTISSVCGLEKSTETAQVEQKRRGRPKKMQEEPRLDSAEFETPLPTLESVVQPSLGDSQPSYRCVITLRVPSKALRDIVMPEPSAQDVISTGRNAVGSLEQTQNAAKEVDLASDSVHINTSPSSIGPRSNGRGRGRRRPANLRSNNDGSACRPWTCQSCGGSWKNDIGLKYHLEKSKTPCNPEYSPTTQGLGCRGKKPPFFSSKAHRSLRETSVDGPPGRIHARRGLRILETANIDSNSADIGPMIEPDSKSEHLADSQMIINKSIDPKGACSPSVGTIKSWKRPATVLDGPTKFSVPKGDQGLLSQSTANRPRREPVFQSHPGPIRIANGRTASHGGAMGYTFNQSGPSAVLPLATHSISETPECRRIAQPFHGAVDQVSDSRQDCDPNHTHSFGLSDTKPKHPVPKPRDGNADLQFLVKKMLSEQHGVGLGGKFLWDSILAIWNTEYPEKATPSKTEFQSTANRLLRDGSVIEHWHAFRDTSGSFSKCQLLTLPGVDAFSVESLRLIETVKRSQFAARRESNPSSGGDSGFSEVKTGGRGRRLLAKEVATLQAPVYAAQVAAKKELGSETRDRVKRQRQSGTRDRVEDIASFLPAKRQKKIRFTPAELHPSLPAAHHGLPYESRRMISGIKVQFLQPNTFLEQDPPDDEHLESMLSDDKQKTAQEQAIRAMTSTENDQVEDPFGLVNVLTGCNGTWPWLDTKYFERTGGSFTIEGWMPNTQWFECEAINHAVEKRYSELALKENYVGDITTEPHLYFIHSVRACLELEMACPEPFINTALKPAGPRNIFVSFFCKAAELATSGYNELHWPKDGQFTPTTRSFISPMETDISPSSDDDFDLKPSSHGQHLQMHTTDADYPETMPQVKGKRVALVTRPLTSLRGSKLSTVCSDDSDLEGYPIDTPNELMAAFIAVRTLLGGADKAIDWGLLLLIFPNTTLRHLRRFWANLRKQQGPYIAKFTRAFQERIIIAFEHNEIAMLDFDKPQDYDWLKLIRWTIEIPRQEGFQIPSSRELLNDRFSLGSNKSTVDDWRERFFHVQASIFSRFEAVTSSPAARAIGENSMPQTSIEITSLEIARSWVKSLCGMGDGKYSVEDIRDKFFTLFPGNKRKTSALFKEAIELLTKQRVICRSKKPPLGGRPYRLNEGYIAALGKMSQNSKYDDAALFKLKLDAAFRSQEKLMIPYSLSDGDMMALTNLNAAGRIKLVATNLPDIPFGFEPGNYESRKYPKSYYHFGLEVVPAETYLFNDQIDVLKASYDEGPPSSSQSGELPQWVDIFGEPNNRRWSEILGAFCFTTATRGSMDIEGICSALNPILDGFEARLIVRWGKKTGVLTDFSDGIGSLVGEWWWLVVPWLRRSPKQ
ncbi:hypothetical protein QQS21_005584 [Conoideocrella luteorostrata]|uniref:TFIIIC transcription initiation factor complex subunits Tfc3 n=1 Tax=Conoideocrella luteorostrata TaxID=1105319 RepID=A0AAJ0CS95_9HYPO|nr:hypothetical protein QQS21_005584 [Conoideocrella luteorostrata]